VGRRKIPGHLTITKEGEKKEAKAGQKREMNKESSKKDFSFHREEKGKRETRTNITNGISLKNNQLIC